ncbi:MAG: hypothetical protein V3T83_03900 [Acidobacteriota bacterium]
MHQNFPAHFGTLAVRPAGEFGRMPLSALRPETVSGGLRRIQYRPTAAPPAGITTALAASKT